MKLFQLLPKNFTFLLAISPETWLGEECVMWWRAAEEGKNPLWPPRHRG